MRSLLILIPVLLFIRTGAQNDLRIIDTGGDQFKLYINDSLCKKNPENQVQISRIYKDSIKVKVEFANGNCESLLILLEKGRKTRNKEFRYQVRHKDGACQIMFDGIHAMLSGAEKIVPEAPAIDTSKKYDDNILGRYAQVKNRRISYFDNIPGNGKCVEAMPVTYFNFMKQLLRKAESEDDAYSILDNTARNNCINVTQMQVMLKYIPLEIEKLKFIRTAYFSLVDPQDRERLDSSLNMAASKKLLQDFFSDTESYRFKSTVKCDKVAGDKEMEERIGNMKLLGTDSEKLFYFKKNYSEYCYSIDQIKSLLQLFLHDREKIEISKLLFPHCTEMSRYSEIEPFFSYRSSMADVEDFIKKQR